jgi:hypothetical protein
VLCILLAASACAPARSGDSDGLYGTGLDLDGDGYAGSEDCDDGDPSVHPGAEEACNGIDDDCDGSAEPAPQAWYPDRDGDGYGDDAGARVDCEPLPDEVAVGGDCDDGDDGIHPGADDDCDDDIDQDCDGRLPSCAFSGEYDLSEASAVLWSDQAGFSAAEYMAIGDVNGDGNPDIGVTARAADSYLGSAYVLYGPFSGARTMDEAGDRITSDATTTKLGRSIAMGDVNQDGYADLAIGAADQTCREWVLFGPLTGDTSILDADITRIGLMDTEAGHGSELDDLDGDGVVDLIVGAYEHDGGGFDAGAVYIDYGPITAGTDNLETTWDALLIGESRGAYAGRYVRTGGDVDGDGLRDLLVAAPYASGGAPQSGAAYLVHGGVLGERSLADADAKYLGEAANDYAGEGQALGDVDGDGRADILLGSYSSTSALYAGAVYAVLGPGTHVSALANADSILRGETNRQQFGLGLAASDIDGDGVDDLLIGAMGDRMGGSNAGAGFLYWGPLPSGGGPEDADATFVSGRSNSAVGMSAAIADLDRNGTGDIILGAPADNTGGGTAGAVYLQLAP